MGHIYHAAKVYTGEVKKIGSEASMYAHIIGAKNDDYVLIETWTIAIHLVTVDTKDDHDVKGMLIDMPTFEEDKEHYELTQQELNVKKHKRRSKKWAKKVADAPY